MVSFWRAWVSEDGAGSGSGDGDLNTAALTTLELDDKDKGRRGPTKGQLGVLAACT